MGWFKNRSGHEYSGRHGSSTCSNEERLENPASKAIIYRSEIDYISRCILDYPNIETGVNRYASTEILETFWQFRAPKHCHVWFWRWAEVVKSLQEAE